MDETFFSNISHIADCIKPIQAIADSLKPIQSIAASLVPCEQVLESARIMQESISSSIDMSGITEAASSISASLVPREQVLESTKVMQESISSSIDISGITEAASNIKTSLEPVIEVSSAISDMVKPVTSTIEVISKTTEVVRKAFDFSGITAVIMRTVDLFAGIGGLLRDSFTAFHERMHETIHNFWHWLVAHFIELLDRQKERRQKNLLLTLKQVIILCPNPCIKSLVINFHEHTPLIRKIYLLRNQDRGSDDSSDNYCYDKVTLLTA